MRGATIGVYSAVEGDGTEFTHPGSAPGPRRRVLVADDNVDSAESLAMLLTLMGNEVRTAADGVEAVEIAATFRPDVAVLDIGMPRMNGHEAARRIRAESWGQGIALIALTGWGQEEDRRRTAEAGFDLHLTKPMDPSTLESLLQRVSRKK
ncbi:MAG TPA: response regulator [Urbifossiella sp.]|jgi:CheY-like chemotaxis protein|nr:response regulator [Urbifossiella sp.]